MAQSHELKNVLVTRLTHARYICTCGTQGYATIASPCVGVLSVRRKAEFNHKQHQKRALAKGRPSGE